MRRGAGAVALATAVVVLAGCAAPAPMIQPGSAVGSGVSADLERFYDQQVEWTDCGTNFDCTRVEVPINYDDPEGGTIEIAVKRFTHTGAGPAAGTLFVNPGGPGGSGIEMVESTTSYLSSTLSASMDVIGFDPRGVGESHGVRCYDDAQLEEWYSASYDLETDAGWDAMVADATAYGQACLENTGPVMQYLDTVSAAKDLDVLRGVLDQDTLTYLGFSYGTFLGATYAELFPDRVGRLVLDGAVDPALSYDELAAGQNVGFERAYRSYLEDCLAGTDCPFTGSVDAAWDRTVALRDELAETPVPTDDADRPATDSELMSAISLAMYDPGWWPTLTDSLTMLMSGDGSQILLMADIAADRDNNGHYPDDEGAYWLIDCLDYPVSSDRAEITADAEALVDENDLFGPSMGYRDVMCSSLPFASTAVREPITVTTSTPIVVVGTTRDPATPYEWAQSLADQLGNSVLLSFDGDGHTAYMSTACISDPIDGFLIEGTVPQDGLMC